MTEEESLIAINKLVREEHGSSVKIYHMWTDANVDSFGTLVVFLELDELYGCFDKDWLSSLEAESLRVKEVVDRIINAS